MSIFLVGGGADTVRTPTVYEHVIKELNRRSAARNRVARIAVVLFDHQGSGAHFLPSYAEPLESRIACSITAVYVRSDEQVDPAVFSDVDAILVGGGPTPAYLEGLQGAARAINQAVVAGVPYLGFSAGAMIAPNNALIGGHKLNGAEICPEEWAEGLSEITFRPGLGLLSFAVDVHAAQAGTLGRAISAVSHGLADVVTAIDEDTALVVSHTQPQDTMVVGTGHSWTITKTAGETTVSMNVSG